jgi:hypothetical protein
MNLALGCFFLLLGSMCLYVATRPLQASTPWAAYKTVLNRLSGVASGG